ncbi:unnamed protein product [Mytilus coruscus]|uniref:Uncharacterized protein n=1 Tax=Mytilus coruscus TaxID=42192 RepID=A0A6J8AQC5_MYTCO|nr:unnamed protein product [Mytilus coruscus]
MSDCTDLGACGALLYLKSDCQDLGARGALLFPKMSDCQDLGACGALLYLKMSDFQDLGACEALLFPKMSDCKDLGACGALLFLKMSDCQDLETVHNIQVTAAYLKYPPGRMGRVVGRRKLGHQLMEQQTSIEMEQKIDIDVFKNTTLKYVDSFNHPAFKLRCKQLPPLGDKSDHDIVLYDSTTKSQGENHNVGKFIFGKTWMKQHLHRQLQNSLHNSDAYLKA